MDFYALERTLPSTLNAAETFELTDQILTLCDPVLPTGNDIRRSLWQDIKEAQQVLGNTLGREKGTSPFTPLRARYDEDRDRAFSQLVRRVTLTLEDDQEDDVQRDAARTIQSVLDNHPNDLHRQNDAKNTAELKLLIPKLRQGHVDAALQKLGLKKYVDRLEAANDAFVDVVEQAAKAEGQKEGLPTVREATRRVRWLVSVLRDNLNYGVYRQDEAITELVKEIDAATTKVNASALARQTRAQQNDATEDVEEEELAVTVN